MIPRIKNKGAVPRGGWWKYTQPETGERIVNGDWDTFLGLIKQHRRRKGIPIGLGFEREIEDYICLHQQIECEDSDPAVPRVGKLSMGDIVRGMRVIASFKAAGSPLVPKEEAYRRAEICARCKFNVTFSRPCGGLCPELKQLVKAVIGNEKNAV